MDPTATKTAPPLNRGRLSRAPWWPPALISAWILMLTFGCAWALASWSAAREFERLGPRYQHAAHSAWWHLQNTFGLSTPLVIGLLLAGIGLGLGMFALERIEGATQQALRYKFMEPSHWLTQRVHALAARMDLPPPRVGIMAAANAFAVGTNPETSAVIIGVPLIKNLRSDELDAIIGHELGHIACGDSRGRVFAEGFQSLFAGIFATLGVVVQILLQVAVKHGHAGNNAVSLTGMFGQLGRALFGWGSDGLLKLLSQRREFYADAIGGALTTPDAMARALQRLDSLPPEPATRGGDQYAYLMFRSSFSTHPSTARRVAALQQRTYVDRVLASAEPAATASDAGGDAGPVPATAANDVRPVPAPKAAKVAGVKARIEPRF